MHLEILVLKLLLLSGTPKKNKVMIHRTWLTTILITTVAWTDYSGAHFESGVVDTTLTVRFSSMSSTTVSNSGLRASFFSPVIAHYLMQQ